MIRPFIRKSNRKCIKYSSENVDKPVSNLKSVEEASRIRDQLIKGSEVIITALRDNRWFSTRVIQDILAMSYKCDYQDIVNALRM